MTAALAARLDKMMPPGPRPAFSYLSAASYLLAAMMAISPIVSWAAGLTAGTGAS